MKSGATVLWLQRLIEPQKLLGAAIFVRVAAPVVMVVGQNPVPREVSKMEMAPLIRP